MPRKIFISFLGNTNYSKCTYFAMQEQVTDIRFVQEATIQLYCEDCDQYLFFLTEDAEQKNWRDDGHKTRDGDVIRQDGLSTRLKKLGVSDKVQAVRELPLGVTEAEIWSIFDLIFDKIENQDIVYIDITHALRSIPMLLLSLIHYAKFLKQIEVAGIYYGVYEPSIQPARFPILDITAFSQLQDWTSAANAFIRFGSGDALAELATKSGQADMGEALLNFCRNISAVRFLDIYEDKSASFIRKTLQETGVPDNVPLKPILAEVENKLEVFKENAVSNGLEAVGWCLEHDLIQQGLTILFEYAQTQVLCDLGETDWKSQKKRDLISWALSIKKIDNIKDKYESGELADELMELAQKAFLLPYKKEITKVYMSLGIGTRHDMNHAGIRDKPKSADELRKSLEKNYHAIKKILKPL
jgi:CRISPR-associated Csx2 family protein